MSNELAIEKVFEIKGCVDELLNILQEGEVPPPPPPTPTPTPRAGRNIGINLTRPTYWDNIITYADALRQAGFVTGYDKLDQQDIPVDSNGRPSVATPYNSLKLGGQVPIYGDLNIVNNGEFQLVLNGNTKIKFANVATFNESGIIKFPDGLEKENFRIEESSLGSDWKLFYPGQSINATFHSFLLESLSGFSCVRAMDWTLTNDSKQANWSDRRKQTDMGQSSSSGACWEDVIQLANEVNSDLWICIPHNATDDYITNLADLIADNLRSDVSLYVEYSNEVWNSARAFRGQYAKALEVGAREFPSETNYFKRSAKGYGYLANEAYKVFDNVYGKVDKANYICAWQAAANFSHKYAIEECEMATHLSIAPYLYLPKWQDDADIEATIERAKTEGMQRSRDQMEKYQGLADEYGLEMSCYECGNHIGGNENAERSYEFANSPELENILIDYDAMIEEVSGNIPRCYFNYGGKPRSGWAFGAQDYSGNTENPKWKALRWLIDN